MKSVFNIIDVCSINDEYVFICDLLKDSNFFNKKVPSNKKQNTKKKFKINCLCIDKILL